MKEQKKVLSRIDSAQIQMITAMSIFGTVGIVVKKIPLLSGEIALFRAIIAVIAIVGLQLIRKKKLCYKVNKKDLPILMLSGVAMAFNWILLFQAYKYTSVSIATLSYYFAPVIVVLLSSVIFHEKISRKQMICFGFASIGLILVMNINYSDGNGNHIIGILFGLGAAFLYALVILLNKKIKHITGIDRTICQFVASILVLLPYVIVTSGIWITSVGSRGLMNLMILGLLHTGVTYVLYFSSIKNLTGQKVAILSYIDPLIAVIASVIVLAESISLQQFIGGFMILIFTLLDEGTFS